jgi:formylmethanofuran dehydrogenase subunit C
MALRLLLRQASAVPLELEHITPDAYADKTLDELRRAPIYHGNHRCELGEFFDVVGDDHDTQWHFEGDCAGIHWLGSGMTGGEIIVHGPVGRHVGSAMSGGRIVVHGDAGDWGAAEMGGGVVQIHGNCGQHLGSIYRGSRRGMTGGIVLVDGNVDGEAGKSMRRGIIAIGGNCGELLAVGMLAGTVLVLGRIGERCCAGMRRGTVILADPDPPAFLPTIRHATACQPLALRLIFRHLELAGFALPADLWNATFHMHHADLLEGGRGEIFVREAGEGSVWASTS